MHLGAERRHDASLGRPRQPPAQASEPDARRLDAALRRRDLRQLALLGLKVADEPLEAPRGLGELADHALVVGPLVPHLRQERAPLRRLEVHLALLALGVGVQPRQLPLARLLPALSVGQLFRRSTILLDQASVQGGEAREVSDGRRTRDGVVVAQDDRQRAALGVDAVHRPQPPGERVFLPPALALKAADLGAEDGHVGLGALDALRESLDLGLLHRQAALALLELGEQRRLARARGGGLRTLLLSRSCVCWSFFCSLVTGSSRFGGWLAAGAARARSQGSARSDRARTPLLTARGAPARASRRAPPAACRPRAASSGSRAARTGGARGPA